MVVAATLLAGCGGGRPVHTSRPSPAPDPRPVAPRADLPPEVFGGVPPKSDAPMGGDVVVRVALHWTPGSVEIESSTGLDVDDVGRGASAASLSDGEGLVASAVHGTDEVRARTPGGVPLVRGTTAVRLRPRGDGRLTVNGVEVRGTVEFSARADSLFVVNELPMEDYLRGVVPKEIGPRPPEDREAVAAQAVAARTYTVRRLGQYNSLPFDVFGDVQDQVYVGVNGEHAVADAAIEETESLILVDHEDHLVETFYSSTCGGHRSDIEAVWPHRESHPALRGGPDGPRGREWCRASRHFQWKESWDVRTLSGLFRKHAPRLLELPEGSIRGELTDVRITSRGPSGRAAEIEWTTDRGRWVVPGDRNRWILRRPGGGILRSVFLDLDVIRSGRRIASVTATGRGNGHGVGMCQMGALGRAEAGQSFREILDAYYPGTQVRRVRGADLPSGRSGAF